MRDRLAKKIRKARMSLSRLFVMLFLPWVIMGVVAALMSIVLGVPDYVSIIVALAAALVATYFIRDYETKRGTLRPR